MAELECVILQPECQLTRKIVDQVMLSGSEGDMGILPGHMPLISSLRDGSQVSLHVGGEAIERYIVAGAIARISGWSIEISAEYAIAVSKITDALIKEMESRAENADDKYHHFCRGLRRALLPA